MAEWSKATVSKTVIPRNWNRGFESPSLLICIICMSLNLSAAYYDNQFWPLYPKKFFTWQQHPTASGYMGVRGLFLGADNSFITDDDEQDLFGIFGNYNELILNQALLNTGAITNSLIPPQYLTLPDIPWSSAGKMSLRGIMFEYEFDPWWFLSFGGSIFLGHSQIHRLSTLQGIERLHLHPGDVRALQEANVAIQDTLGLCPPCFTQWAFGDLNFFIKGHYVADYFFKLQHLDTSLACGVLIPTAPKRKINNPVSLPIGGDGHWGLYGQWDLDAILKEDLSAGFSLWFCKRLSKTSVQRMPVLTEPTNYGALILPAQVNPGLTIAFFPYVQISGLRGGFGAAIGYYMVRHFSDRWCIDGLSTTKPNLGLLHERSKWGRDDFMVSLFYDLGYDCDAVWYRPLISVSVDIPWDGPVTLRVPKTHGISLRIESCL